ncbi:MAG: hypothetical protein GY715_09090 [Planctomycetes bacterium]|nr:hypothetical protein [Planctomycetota bacterium]
MSITTVQLRTALADLNGQRDMRIGFDHADTCVVPKALLVPAEEDRIVKLTDGTREFLVDAQRIAWIEIGPPLTAAVST